MKKMVSKNHRFQLSSDAVPYMRDMVDEQNKSNSLKKMTEKAFRSITKSEKKADHNKEARLSVSLDYAFVESERLEKLNNPALNNHNHNHTNQNQLNNSSNSIQQHLQPFGPHNSSVSISSNETDRSDNLPLEKSLDLVFISKIFYFYFYFCQFDVFTNRNPNFGT